MEVVIENGLEETLSPASCTTAVQHGERKKEGRDLWKAFQGDCKTLIL